MPQCLPHVNRENADFDVQLNWTQQTRLLELDVTRLLPYGSKIIHKPDQILVTNRSGDILYSGIARSVGGDVEGACKAIEKAEPAVAQARETGAATATNETYQTPRRIVVK
jgi:hypothetical protein